MLHTSQILAWLTDNRDLDKIKIVTAVRGYGKSTVLKAFATWLRIDGVPAKNILHINLDSSEFRHVHAPEDLFEEVVARTPSKGKVYLLLDEICELQSFNKALRALHDARRYNIFAFGAARRPISDRFIDELAGKYVHKRIAPSVFRDVPTNESATFDRRLDEVMRLGAFPSTFSLRPSQKKVHAYLRGLWYMILVKDILSYNRLADARLAELLLEHVYLHLGETESLRRIAADAKIEGREPSPNTVQSYIDAFDDSLLFKRIPKYDVFLGEVCKTGYRLYIVDIAIGYARYGVLPNNPDNAVRNLIYLELFGRDTGTAYAGGYHQESFDFVVVKKDGSVHCWQYAPKTVNGRIPAAVLRPFKRMPSDVKKTVITGQGLPKKEVPGIDFITLEQFFTRRNRDVDGPRP